MILAIAAATSITTDPPRECPTDPTG